MSKLLAVLFCSMAVLFAATPAHAQHRGCHAGSYASYGSTFSTFASPFFVSTPFVPTVALPVPVVASASLLSTYAQQAPLAASFPLASAAPVIVANPPPVFATTFVSPFVFGIGHRTYRHR